MFFVGFDVDRKILVVFWVVEPVELFQSVDLRFADRRNLRFVCVKRRQPFSGRLLTANGSECPNKIVRLGLLLSLLNIAIIDAKGSGELFPKLGMIRRPG